MNLQIQSTSTNVLYNAETIALLSFVRRLMWLDVPNTEDPAIYVNVSDKHYDRSCNDETYKFMMFLLDNLKFNSYLAKPIYKECLDKMLLLKVAYDSSSLRRTLTRGKIVSYKLSNCDSMPPPIDVIYENGDVGTIAIRSCLMDSVKSIVAGHAGAGHAGAGMGANGLTTSMFPIEITLLANDLLRYCGGVEGFDINVDMDNIFSRRMMDTKTESSVSQKPDRVLIVSYELDEQTGNVRSLLSNGETRLDTPNMFLIIQYTGIYPSVLESHHSYNVSSLLNKLKKGKYDTRVMEEPTKEDKLECERYLSRILNEMKYCKSDADIEELIRGLPVKFHNNNRYGELSLMEILQKLCELPNTKPTRPYMTSLHRIFRRESTSFPPLIITPKQVQQAVVPFRGYRSSTTHKKIKTKEYLYDRYDAYRNELIQLKRNKYYIPHTNTTSNTSVSIHDNAFIIYEMDLEDIMKEFPPSRVPEFAKMKIHMEDSLYNRYIEHMNEPAPVLTSAIDESNASMSSSLNQLVPVVNPCFLDFRTAPVAVPIRETDNIMDRWRRRSRGVVVGSYTETRTEYDADADADSVADAAFEQIAEQIVREPEPSAYNVMGTQVDA